MSPSSCKTLWIGSERGSAALDFLAFGIPTFIASIIFTQILVAGYLSNVCLDAAVEGSLAAAAANGSLQQGESYALAALAATTPWAKASATSSSGVVGDRQISSVTVSAVAPVYLFGLQPIQMSAWGFNEVSSQ